MAKRSLPPGFRFHPTDVELVLYYLKRKITGKKLHFEAIAEVNIYKFAPWDLPDKSRLNSKDLEWFFFCPRERKYSSGVRVKRATENGYWKTTGKDRPIHYNDKTVGTVKTLVFHLGHAPQGERTDWVIHEYRIIDDQLASAGTQDSFVLCKVFKKSGPGPKNGAQYGAPFNEADWTDDEDAAENQAISSIAEGPSAAAMMLAEKQSSFVTESFDPGSTSGLSLVEEAPQPSTGPSTNLVPVDESDSELAHLLAMFTDDPTLLSDQNGNAEVGLNDKGKDKSLPCSDGSESDIFYDLKDLDNWAPMNEGRLEVSEQDGYPLNDMLLQDNGYIELNDLLDCSADVIQPDLLAPVDIFGSYGQDGILPFCTAGGYTGLVRCGSSTSQLMSLPEGSKQELNSLNEHQMVNSQVYHLPNTAYAFDIVERQIENGGSMGHFTRDVLRGRFDDTR